MSGHMPPVPPAGRSDKGPGDASEPKADEVVELKKRPPDNLTEQDRQGNIKQNTTNQGYQQDR